MKSPAALAPSLYIHRISLCILTGTLLAGAGCVSEQTYDKTRAETDELTRTLETTRTDINELDQRVAALKAANRQEDAIATELRAAIQQEQDKLPILRQRADEKLTTLQTQVATLVNIAGDGHRIQAGDRGISIASHAAHTDGQCADTGSTGVNSGGPVSRRD
jgi:seryl-tRNA synthetase